MSKILIGKENGYNYPNSRNCGDWGQWLKFADGTEKFDPKHSQNDAIAEASFRQCGDSMATFCSGEIELRDDGTWAPVAKS